ncbi:MAG: aconitase/3-isopropylmalate dehydratase large subunit family protein [Pseudoflavonifractor capillosus]|uniref:3-isopropylmalate dehydratase large subunit n=1 Tax=Pseudoflavonifractor capillosus TaxID=106588 RepID=UPI0008213E55|nr:aconitase/3-isopropylmalate dehydratase large subunit family protein [Pseudoflavonifractor capillosus]MCI5928679.1 aconitase/3-isopropylmalate dehydratase large subunit family protein [Pseudoflavonifractor capillosus]MDY4659832.1 aconitase/3-isopropylmalate dehydratase large subunit family protein [Pseudoflavonifractor capillosus]SCI64152.1 2%2C3-dimethylmalate dehydratase large subunit [uncultured Flavonifractor sp.]
MNCIEKYLARAAGVEEAHAGDDLSCRVSYVAAHDVTAPIAIKMFREIGVKKVFDPDRVVLIVDHIYPAATEKARNSVWAMDDFAKEFGVHLYHRGEGVIHQLMYEKHRANPGDLIAIADSHTGTCGGYGVMGVGVGSTELAAAMATGKLDLEVPQVVQIHLTGKKPANVFGKDLILYLGSVFGTDYLVDKALLFTGEGIEDFSVAERMTVCNMGIEIGSMITIFGTTALEPDTAEVREVNLSELEPQIARPFSPANVVPVREVAGTPVTQVVVGSCTNGRINDMEQVAKAFEGKKVHPDVNTLIVPASRDVLDEMEKRGWCKIIRDAGATVLNPGCGPCFGAHEGLTSERDVVVSTTNRNFPGRMGSMKANIYLASPATAAATALAGKITVPEVED